MRLYDAGIRVFSIFRCLLNLYFHKKKEESMEFLYLPYLHLYFHVAWYIVCILFLLEDIFWVIVM